MQVLIGSSRRRGRSDTWPNHLFVVVAERQALACTGGAVTNTTAVEVDVVMERLTCGPCRRFWRRTRDVPRTADAPERPGSGPSAS